MVNEKLARRYADAIFALAKERGAIDDIGRDLDTIAAAIGERGDAHDFFLAPVIDRPVKGKALVAAFGSRVHEIALNALLLLVRKRREALLGAIVAEYRKLALASRGAEPLTVTSARELSREELASVVGRIEHLYGKKFEVTQVVDPNLIGGMRVLMGDRRVDGTVSGRLEALTRTLFANN